MISCEYIGRFGNNLFQIAATISLAEENGDEAIFSPWGYSFLFKNIKFSDKKLNLEINNHNDFHYSKIFYEKNKSISGYFQSEKYFNKDLIFNKFKINGEITNKIKNIGAIENDNKSVAIHVRRGDYVELALQHPPVTIEYLKKSMDFFKDMNFYIFSDDIKWCKNNIFGQNIMFIEGNKNYEDFILMSLCRNNIISNSSFSWWAAFLNKNEDKKIIAPKNWFGPKYENLETKDIYCKDWIIL